MSNKALKMLVILGSDRPGRVGERVGKWVMHSLEAYPQFTVNFADLAQLDLGLKLSAHHPRTGTYEGGVRGLSSKLGKSGAIVSYGAAWGACALKTARDATPYPA